MSQPNTALRAVRIGLRMSQDDLARAIRDAGRRAGYPNDASKRLVQRWEAGVIAAPRPAYARALEAVTGLPIEALGFGEAVPDGHGGHDIETPAGITPAAPGPRTAPQGNYSGVWLSRYEFFSSSRSGTFVGQHYVVILQHGDRLTVRSLPDSAEGLLTMDLTVEGSVLTGTWVEHTNPAGHYRGARYYGAVQLLAEPTGRRLVGKWVGFGKELDINTGPWELTFQDASTSRATLARYNTAPEPARSDE